MKETDNAINAAIQAMNNIVKEADSRKKIEDDEVHNVNPDVIIPLSNSSIHGNNAGINSLAEEEEANRIEMAEAENAGKLLTVGDGLPGEAMNTH